ncbi:aliphatic sulfonate ABC transporter, periplasmic substrate-binding protein (plasmid) [Aliarcobacter cibarius]|uniref:sulfonate ABC transporter substrate-binding protein n=1 Tax=Aliarcobacter cibarius TaxID=255507 RepID=UPI0012468CB5|nr:sulfonate ABC transporter substrate-binding protein [Aliarcobacter cibarius]QEZ90225.1 aliphatic sulfonate ABC transporter, periplasmic substrate-binding protein [Aliarcobacter cibarius]
MKNIIKKVRNIALISLLIPAIGFGKELDKKVEDEVRIGYQKYGTLILLKASGELEKRLAPLGVKVTWSEFPAGPQLLEGLNVGGVDFGTTGETPPIFAQAANAKIKYIGYEPPAPRGEAIVVQSNSSIKTVADLKGKKVVLNKGSNVHYLLVKALEKAGLKYSDVETVFLAPADARAAFERGSVDAWVIWDPFLAAAETSIGAKVIQDGTNTVNNHQFYLAEENYASKRPDVVAAIFDELKKVNDWAVTKLKEVANALAPLTGLDSITLEKALERGGYGINYLNEKVITEQQKIADTFYDLKLIPKKLDIKSVVWQPEQKNK